MGRCWVDSGQVLDIEQILDRQMPESKIYYLTSDYFTNNLRLIRKSLKSRSGMGTFYYQYVIN